MSTGATLAELSDLGLVAECGPGFRRDPVTGECIPEAGGTVGGEGTFEDPVEVGGVDVTVSPENEDAATPADDPQEPTPGPVAAGVPWGPLLVALALAAVLTHLEG